MWTLKASTWTLKTLTRTLKAPKWTLTASKCMLKTPEWTLEAPEWMSTNVENPRHEERKRVSAKTTGKRSRHRMATHRFEGSRAM
eukprot:1101640-Prorocentrum_minimum.AAC.2